ncbi:hypothetical protein WMY93_013336 [Mugilogobius chulae]|uniref:Ras-associating domain-containing protein n=1 Tax=Mugilogobius chulae TaxID=88201 RepID=A0AAW0P8U8_9GOBI
MAEENRISVWVCREEKLVMGLSKRNSCADVIQVLLKDQNLEMVLSHAPQAYCIVEKWRGFERVLPNKTKIWRLWLAWGPEQKDVKFVLVKCNASFSSHAPRSAEARVVRSEQSPCGVTRCLVGVCPEKQRRIVRKAFRKLEKINKRRARKDVSCAERMETLVHLVLSQDHTTQQQVQRLAELDAEIELCEAQVHLERVRRHGVNYVQNTYLVSAAGDATGVKKETVCSKKAKQLEDYVTICEALVRLQEQISEHEAQIDRLTAYIQEELHLRWMQRKQQQQQDLTPLTYSAGLELESALFLEEEQLKLNWKPADIKNTEGEEIFRVDNLDCQTKWLEQARGLSKAHHVHDDDSDTGLSSLHSQDSDLAQWEAVA